MKILTTLAAAVAALAFAGAASAAPLSLAGDYVQGSVGVTSPSPYQSDGVAVSAAFGRTVGILRGEVEYIHTSNHTVVGTADVNLGNLNLYVQPIVYHGFTPFVGAGIGYGNLSVHHYSANSAVVNVGFGTSYKLTSKLDAVAQYRHFSATSYNYRNDVASVGLRYTF